jgi:AAA+ superfamily predicted ATPase
MVADKLATEKRGSRIVIFVQTPKQVADVRKALEKKKKDYATRITQLTGTMRGLERDELVDTAKPLGDDDRQRDVALRPRYLREVIGQKAVVQRLGIVLNACKQLKEPLPHILFDGPPGLGKTTFATVIPRVARLDAAPSERPAT